MTLRGKLIKSEEPKLRINFKTYDSEEEKLLGKWAYMNVAEDGKGVEVIDKDGERLGRVHRTNEDDGAGDNYFLEAGDTTIMAHKEENGWTLYDVTNNGRSIVKIENEQRAKALKPLFHEARMAMNYPGGRRARVNPMGITAKTR